MPTDAPRAVDAAQPPERPDLESLKACQFETAGYDPYDLGDALRDVVSYALALEQELAALRAIREPAG